MMPAFMSFTLPNKRTIWVLGFASALSMAVYLAASAFYYHIGFPLDDSWIHLTYARNLAVYGQWAFQPGRPSAGSTSPLWTALLSVGFFIRLAPYIWAYLLGGLTLWAMAVFAEIVVRQISPGYQSRIPWIGLFFALEWHLVWAASSGMETLLHALIVTIVLGALMIGSRRFLTLGLLTGLSVWVRPDGITLIGPVLVYALAASGSVRERIGRIVQFFIGFTLLFGAYLLFNLVLSGTPMPNTFYAKQAEYAAWQARPISYRLGRTLLQLTVGPVLALLPGAIAWLAVSLKRRDWGTLVGMVWFVGYVGLYMLRLPPYQHGRYIMPAMPILFIWGLAALFEFLPSRMFNRFHWHVSTTWLLLTGLLSTAFWLYGANSYAQDVALIESEMVQTAKWVAKNIPADDIIAAHDIGALGYFDQHELIDMAGLISPEVIPFIRNETKLASFLDERGAQYLIAFPDFYSDLLQYAEPIYVTNSPIAPKLDGQNMVVFHWR